MNPRVCRRSGDTGIGTMSCFFRLLVSTVLKAERSLKSPLKFIGLKVKFCKLIIVENGTMWDRIGDLLTIITSTCNVRFINKFDNVFLK